MNRLMKKRTFAITIVAIGTALANTLVSAAPLVGLTSSNEIARIDTANLGAATRTAITGLAVGDRFVGIDLRPGDNAIYGITLSNNIYTINELTGVTSFVAALSAPIINPMLGYGIDFNPVADFASASSLRLISSSGGNFAINATTGVVTVASTISSGYSGAAYTNSMPLLSSAPSSTQLYYLNSAADTLAFAGGNFNNPSIVTIGALGVDFLNANGFEILGNGLAFAALNVDNGTSLASDIYGINLATGAATRIGQFNGTLSGLTGSSVALSVSPVPEPGTYALMLVGFAVLGVVGKRRKITGPSRLTLN